MKKRIITILSIITALAMAAVIYILTQTSKPKAVILEDPSWALILPEDEIKNLKAVFSQNSLRLSADISDAVSISDKESIVALIEKYKEYSFVIFSPVETKAIQLYSINASQMIDGIAMGIGESNTDGLFDIILKSDEQSGWNMVDEPEEIIREKEPDASTFRRGDNKDLYVVDYRYVKVIPQNNLQGIVSPDLSLSVSPYLEDRP